MSELPPDGTPANQPTYGAPPSYESPPFYAAPAAASPVAVADPDPPFVASSLSRQVGPLQQQTQLSRLVQLCLWLGVMLIIGAHSWWSTQGFENLGSTPVLLLTLLWQAGFLAAAEWCRRRGHGLPEGGFAAVVAFYMPLTVYTLQRIAGVDFEFDNFGGFYDWVSAGWVWMELVSIAVNLALLRRYSRPFVMFPLSLLTAFLIMDGTAHILGDGYTDTDALPKAVLAGGVVMIVAAVALDLRGWRRFAFWPHLFGIWLVAWGFPWCADFARWSLFLTAAIFLVLGTWLARVMQLAAGGVMLWIAISRLGDGAALPFILMAGGGAFIAVAFWLAQVDSPVRRKLDERTLQTAQRDLYL